MAKQSGGTRTGSARNPNGVGSVKDENYYFNRAENARKTYEQLRDSLESSYPTWERARDYDKGGEAREMMRERMKPSNEAYKKYEESLRDLQEYRRNAERLKYMPPSKKKQKELVTALNKVINADSGQIYLTQDSMSSVILNYNSKEDLANKIYIHIPVQFRKYLKGLKRNQAGRYDAIFPKSIQNKWEKYIKTVDLSGEYNQGRYMGD